MVGGGGGCQARHPRARRLVATRGTPRRAATLAKFQVPEAEQRDVVAFVQGLKKEIVE